MYGLLVVCFLLYFPLTLANKLASKNTVGKSTVVTFSLYNATVGVLIGGLVVLINQTRFSFDFITLSTSVFLGVTLAAYQVAMLYALKQTSVAIVNMITTVSVIFPCLFGVFFFREPVSVGKIVGIIAFLIAAYFITGENNPKKHFTWKSLMMACIASLMSGLGSIAMQLFSRYSTENSNSLFMFYSYCMNALALLIFVCVSNRRTKSTVIERRKERVVFPKKLFWIGAISAMVAFFIQQINVLLANEIPAVILFPVLKSGSLIFGAVVGRTIFKEKLSAKNIIGIVLCIVALIVLNL